MHEDTTDAVGVIRRLHAYRAASFDEFVAGLIGFDDAALRREFEIGMGSVMSTLAHLVGADVVWIDALHGVSGTTLLTADDLADLAAVERAVGEVRPRWNSYLDGLRAADLSRRIERVAMSGERYELRVLDILLHVATHQAHTLAQGRNMVRHLGGENRRNDLVYWGREVVAG